MYIVQLLNKNSKNNIKKLNVLINKLDNKLQKINNDQNMHTYFQKTYKAIIDFFEKIIDLSPNYNHKVLPIVINQLNLNYKFYYQILYKQKDLDINKEISSNYLYETQVYTKTLVIKLNQSFKLNNINYNTLNCLIVILETLYYIANCYKKEAYNLKPTTNTFFKKTNQNIITLKQILQSLEF